MRATGIEQGISSKLCIRLARLANAAQRRGLGRSGRQRQFTNRLLTGADIDCHAEADASVLIPHTVRLASGSTAIVRSGVVLMPHVTLGATRHGADGRRHPIIERNAYIGAGAVLIGAITVGEGAVVGANAVVSHDAVAGATVVGVPAHAVRYSTSSTGDT